MLRGMLDSFSGATSGDGTGGSFTPPDGVLYGALGVANGLAFSGTQNGKVLGVVSGALAWVTPSTGIPAGGASGQALLWSSSGVAAWGNVPAELPSGGSNGQVLAIVSGSLAWATPAVVTFGGDTGGTSGAQTVVSTTGDANGDLKPKHSRYWWPTSGDAATLDMKRPIGRQGAWTFGGTGYIRGFEQAWPDNSRTILDLVATFSLPTGGAGKARRISRTYLVERVAGTLTVSEIGSPDDPSAANVPGAIAELKLVEGNFVSEFTPGVIGTSVVWEVAGHFLPLATS